MELDFALPLFSPAEQQPLEDEVAALDWAVGVRASRRSAAALVLASR